MTPSGATICLEYPPYVSPEPRAPTYVAATAGTASTIDEVAALLDFLAKAYCDVPDAESVRRFLVRRPALMAHIRDAIYEVYVAFGWAQPTRLELATDPEAHDFEELFLNVLTDRDPADALALLEAIDDSWFLEAMAQCEHFNLNLQFV